MRNSATSAVTKSYPGPRLVPSAALEPRNVLDLILVSAQVAEEILLGIAEMNAEGGTVPYNTEMMRVVRILRAIKVVRLVGAVRFAQDLQLLINCLFLSLKQFLWSALLLLLAIYVVAIYITQAATAYRLENPAGQNPGESVESAMTKWWGSMPQSVLSLFQGTRALLWASCLGWMQD